MSDTMPARIWLHEDDQDNDYYRFRNWVVDLVLLVIKGDILHYIFVFHILIFFGKMDSGGQIADFNLLLIIFVSLVLNSIFDLVGQVDFSLIVYWLRAEIAIGKHFVKGN